VKRLKFFHKLILTVSLISLTLFSPAVRATLPIAINVLSEAGKVIIASASIIISGLINKNKIPDFKKESEQSSPKQENVNFRDEYPEININRNFEEKARQITQSQVVKFNPSQLENVFKDKPYNLETTSEVVSNPSLVVAGDGSMEKPLLQQLDQSSIYYDLAKDLEKITFSISKASLARIPIRWGSAAGSIMQINEDCAIYTVLSSPSGRLSGGVRIRIRDDAESHPKKAPH